MVKLEMGILGPFLGKVGTVVGYVWKGRAVVRGYRRAVRYPTVSHEHPDSAPPPNPPERK